MNNSISSIRSSEQGISCEVIKSGKIDLSKVPISDLKEELENRKAGIVETVVKKLNENLRELEEAGFEIIDSDDNDYAVAEYFIGKEGEVFARFRASRFYQR